MATISFVLRTQKKKSNNTVPIYIRLLEGEKCRFISTGCFIKEEDWDNEAQRVCTKGSNDDIVINALINKKKKSLEDKVLSIRAMSNDDRPTVIADLDKIEKKRKLGSFFLVADKYLAELKQMHKYNRVSAEKPRVGHLEAFHGSKNLYFKEIDFAFLNRFKVYLKSEYECSDRTVMNHLVVVRTIYIYAIKEGLANRNDYPFGKGGITIKYPESIKIGLNESEIKALEKLNLSESPHLQYALDAWLFSFYLAGIRISDVLSIKWRDCIDDRLNYRMGKNMKIVSLKLPEKAAAILKKYMTDDCDYDGYVFPELNGLKDDDYEEIYKRTATATGRFNKHLKDIASIAKIKKKLTFHISRHTFGNITGDKISPQMLQKLYRHTDIKTTMGYQANFIHKDVDDALETVLKF